MNIYKKANIKLRKILFGLPPELTEKEKKDIENVKKDIECLKNYWKKKNITFQFYKTRFKLYVKNNKKKIILNILKYTFYTIVIAILFVIALSYAIVSIIAILIIVSAIHDFIKSKL